MEQFPGWADAEDMRALLEAIDKHEVKALSVGLGLGSVQTTTRKAASPLRTPFASPRQEAAPADAAQGMGWAQDLAGAAPRTGYPRQPLIPASAPQVRNEAAVVSKPRGAPITTPQQLRRTSSRPVAPGSNLPKRFFAWSLDFLLVLLSLSIAVAAMIALHAARNAGQPWQEQKPVQWLLNTNPLVIVACVYGVFLVYGVLFKLLVGRTCGETVLGVQPRRGRAVARGGV